MGKISEWINDCKSHSCKNKKFTIYNDMHRRILRCSCCCGEDFNLTSTEIKHSNQLALKQNLELVLGSEEARILLANCLSESNESTIVETEVEGPFNIIGLKSSNK